MKKATPAKKTPRQLSPIRVGNAVFIRSVTSYYTGRIVLLTRDEIVLSDVAWIADTGRFSSALQNGVLSEVEPYPDGALVAVGRGACCDVTDWPHALPRYQK